jgi:phosphoglycerate kinase
MSIRGIEELDLAQRRVLIRVDFNVPLDEDGNVVDDTRIRAALPSIQLAREARARVILMSHLGRPKGKPNPKFSLEPAARRLAELLDDEVILPDDCVGDGVRSLVRSLKDGQIMLLENLRFHKEETAGDESFGSELASLGEVFINDAFGTMHRAHASMAQVPRFVAHKGMGLLVKKEYDSLSKLVQGFRRPFVAVLGGAKVSDKIGVIQALLDRVDALVVGGAMANTFLAAQGHDMGRSLVETDKLDVAARTLKAAREKKVRIVLPEDQIVVSEISADAERTVVGSDRVPADLMAVDIGPATVARFKAVLAEARTVFWNGPMGVYEIPALRKGTEDVAQAVAQISGFSVVGGGDSVAAVRQSGVTPFISHISTGGGASLEYVEGRELPGFTALKS